MPASTSDLSIVSLRDLSVTLTGAAGAVEILRGIDLELSAGETVSVVGPSGAGKTTLLMVVGGLERPTSGQVTVAATTSARWTRTGSHGSGDATSESSSRRSTSSPP